MASYRETQKELRQPDEFQKIGVQAVPWLEQHGKAVVTAVVAVVVVWGGVALLQHFNAKGNEQAAQKFSAALKVLDREVVTVPQVTPPAEGETPPFTSEKEKDEALVAKLSEVRLKEAGHTAAINAALPLAEAYLRLGKPSDALPLFDEYLKSADPKDPMRPEALEGRGYALEMEQKYDDAMAAFDQLARENKTDFMKGMGLYHRGRMLVLKGDKVGAAKQFVELDSVAPNTSAARLAKERVALLAAQGVEIPKPPPPPPAPMQGAPTMPGAPTPPPAANP
jgi:hypothetical protein